MTPKLIALKPFLLVCWLILIGLPLAAQPAKIWFDQMELGLIHQGWETAKANINLRNKPITLGGKVYDHGVCTHAFSEAIVALDGNAVQFHAVVGIEDINKDLPGRNDVIAYIVADKKRVWTSPRLTAGGTPAVVDLDLKGIKHLELYIEGIDGDYHTHTSWADAWFSYQGTAPKLIRYLANKPEENIKHILTPKPGPAPRLTGPKVFGVRLGSPVVYRFTATGNKPITFNATGLPAGVKLDNVTGQLSGSLTTKGDYVIQVTASNKVGKATRDFTLKVGDLIGLTPALGWNSWNCWGMAVDQDKVKAAADAMVNSGLADHGWTYINMDDGWEGEDRDPKTGEITTDPVKFPDMKGLADYVHSKGLKIGIYSSPGKLTCGKRLGSLLHEAQDAATYARWGIDYLKYDRCSYDQAIPVKQANLYWEQLPYRIMRDALRSQSRDIIYSMCQYGRMDVFAWGADMDANSWRTTGDIIDTWASMRNIGFNQFKAQPYTKPGRFNDPDMLVVGKVGWGPSLHDTRLTADEQFTHISLWALLSSPLLLGNDLSALDPFTLSLLTNDEVIEVNQDEAANPARKIYDKDDLVIVAKTLADGSVALGLFNLSFQPQTCSLSVKELESQLGMGAAAKVRDLWRQQDQGKVGAKLNRQLPGHGCYLLKLTKS